MKRGQRSRYARTPGPGRGQVLAAPVLWPGRTQDNQSLERRIADIAADVVPPGGGAPAPHAPSHTATGSDPLPYVDLPEVVAVAPPADHARLHGVDVNGFTAVEALDSAGKSVRLALDTVLVAKVTEPAGVLRGQVVYLAGATGANPEVRLARADVQATMPAIGVLLDTGVLNAFVRVLLGGTLQAQDTSAFAEGVPLFVSPTTAGSVTPTFPARPALPQRVGFVTRSHATQGELLVVLTGVDITGIVQPMAHAPSHEPGGSDALTALSADILTSGTVSDARLSSNVALENVVNVFTQNQRIEKTTPRVQFVNTANPVDTRHFEIVVAAQELWVQALNDAESAGLQPLKLTRSGNALIAADIYEKARTTALGHWQAVSYGAANFGAPSGTWTVEAGDVLVNRYTLIGKTLIWRLELQTTSLSAPTPTVGIVLPAGMQTGPGGARGICKVADGVAWQHADIYALASSAFLNIGKIDFSNWPIVTNGFYLYLCVTCEVL